jgi:serine protease
LRLNTNVEGNREDGTSQETYGGPMSEIKRTQEDQFSGFIILRLSARVPASEAGTWAAVVQRNKLGAIASVLKAFKLASPERLLSARTGSLVVKLEQEAAQTEFPPLHSLNSYWRIDARERWTQVEQILERLRALVEVDKVYKEFATSDPVVNAADDDYNGTQNYLDAAPTGVDARWAWTQANGEGAGVAVVDLEQGWFLGHEDLSAKAPTLIYGGNRDGVGGYKGNHGTAVLGEIVGVDNDRGVVGIAPAVTSVRVASHYRTSDGTDLHVADAMVAAVGVMSVGDVLLVEVQRNYLPSEVDDADYDAIRLAVAHGIIVVEAAGNGNNNLDTYTDGGNHILNRTDPAFRESGAIMVGASVSAVAAGAHERWAYSNYGSRIDCYGWGENIVSCGYGDLDPGTGDNSTYTDTFGGTSGASPMIVGCALVLQGMYEATTGTRLSPGQMRSLLANPATGTPQGVNVAGNINVMPDLRAIIEDTLGIVPDVYIRDNTGDTGDIPSVGGISASPDIIVRAAAVADPTGEFGEGSGNENSSTLGFEVESGQNNFVYVRMKNRGLSDATNVTAAVYWSEVATLVTPNNWHLIGSTPPVTVPQGDTLVVAGPITWAKASIPGTGHYCFVGLASNAQDPAPPIPSPFDWNGFTNFIRNHNNVTWRNFNVVDNLADDPSSLPFMVAGAPDKPRLFDLEVLQRLPRGVEVWLEVPLALGRYLARETNVEIKVDTAKRLALLRLPAVPRLPFSKVMLGENAKFRCRFLVRGTKRVANGGSVAIRQVFEGLEVGRVTWQFLRRK